MNGCVEVGRLKRDAANLTRWLQAVERYPENTPAKSDVIREIKAGLADVSRELQVWRNRGCV